MRTFTPAFAAHIAGEATTLCRCWRVTRRDSAVFGFTDHDRDLVFDGVTFRAGAGVAASAINSELGLAVGGGEIAGALASDSIGEDELAAGLWDDASLDCFIVDWSNPSSRLLSDRGVIGEVRRADNAFVAELRGMAAQLDEERGRLFETGCSATLGDARCGVALAGAAYSATSAVATTEAYGMVTAAGLAGYAVGWFAGGRLIWLSGANLGVVSEVREHRASGIATRLEFWRRTPGPIVVGDTFRVEAGCDKRFETCRAKFANVLNFRGFPHIPGEDLLARVIKQGEPGLDGGSLFR